MNKLKLLHLNIQLIKPNQKKIQLKSLKIKHNTDSISINETFLKTTDEQELDGYKIIRSVRPNQRGGSTAF